MPKKLQSDDDDLMKIFEHYAELRREHTEYQDTVHALECDIASLQGRVDQLEELNKQLTEERDQFLERYYRLVTQFEPMGGSFDRARRHHRCNRILARSPREARTARNAFVAGV
jgi:predicted nuclease with TOPRIM domain